MSLRDIEHRFFLWTRFLALAAVLGSLAGSLLMFGLGLMNIVDAFLHGTPLTDNRGSPLPTEAASVIHVIVGLDRFLIAIVLLYFAYGVYSLFVRPEQPEETLSLPRWLHIKQIGQLKQVVAEVIIVVLFVLFLRVALAVFQAPDYAQTCRDLSWRELATVVALPVSIALLALALRLVELHPKPSPRMRPKRREPPVDPNE